MTQADYYTSTYRTSSAEPRITVVASDVESKVLEIFVKARNVDEINLYTTSFTSQSSANWLLQYFSISDRNVLTFLSLRLDLVNLLMSVYRQISTRLNIKELSLDFVKDPEIPNWNKLQLSVFVDSQDNEAYEKFEEFNENWWFDCLDEAAKDLFIIIKIQ